MVLVRLLEKGQPHWVLEGTVAAATPHGQVTAGEMFDTYSLVPAAHRTMDTHTVLLVDVLSAAFTDTIYNQEPRPPCER